MCVCVGMAYRDVEVIWVAYRNGGVIFFWGGGTVGGGQLEMWSIVNGDCIYGGGNDLKGVAYTDVVVMGRGGGVSFRDVAMALKD